MMIWEGSWFQRRSAGHCGSVKEIPGDIYRPGRRDHLKKIFPHRGTVRICRAVCGKPGADHGVPGLYLRYGSGRGSSRQREKGAYRQIYQLPAYEASGRADSHHISRTGKASVKIISEQEGDYLWEVIHPIICEGDVIGGVILLSRDEKKKFTGAEQKVASCAADFLGRQMEQ